MAQSKRDKCIDEASLALRKAEDCILEIMKDHMGGVDKECRKALRKANRKLLNAHCALGDARDDCFPDYEPGPEVQAGGT